MKIYKDYSIEFFEFSNGAKINADQLRAEEWSQLENCLSIEYPDGIEASHLDDLFDLEFGYICTLLDLQYDTQRGAIIR